MNRERDRKRRTLCFFLTKKLFYCIIISVVCRCGEIGRHEGLKIPFWRQSTGSTPVGGIKNSSQPKLRAVFYFAPDAGSNSTAARRRQAISPMGCCLVRGSQRLGTSIVVAADGCAGRGVEQGATATTAACGRNREAPLGPRPARHEHKRSGCWVPQPDRLASRSQSPSGALTSTRVPTARNVHRGCCHIAKNRCSKSRGDF